MPKESRRSGSRGSNRRQSSEASDDGKKSSSREPSTKIAGSVNRFAPFQREITRRESKSDEEETFTTLIRSTTTMTNSNPNTKSSSGIIENGMKYIMFPLHLLRFCIFGTTTTLPIDDRKVIEPSEEDNKKERSKKVKDDAKNTVESLQDKNKEKEEKSEDGRRSSDDSKRSSKYKVRSSDSKNQSEKRSSRDQEESNDRGDRISEKSRRRRVERSRSIESRKSFTSRRADEDSDSSSSDKWSTAESSMDVSIEYASAYEMTTTPYGLVEPMDISIEESIDENLPSIAQNSSHRTGTSRIHADPIPSSSSSSEIEEISSSSSIEEEIARVFRKKCTSSCSSDHENDDDSSPSSSPRDGRRNEPDRRNRDERNESVVPRSSSHDSKTKSEKTRVKPSPRKKEESHRDKIVERRGTSTVTTTSSSGHNASPRRVSKTPIKSKDTKKRYKEKGIQTDSAFSDDDVEMIPLDTRFTEKRTSGRFYRRRHQSVSYQMEGMDQDILYIADNEDSNDGYGRYSRNRISPVSGSSSSTDLGFEDQRYPTPNYRSHVTQRERTKSSLRDNATIKDDRPKEAPLPRAPPGFPQVPQNPPIPLKVWNDQDSFGFPFTTETNPSVLQYGPNYPPAPTPMRHLYHEYPEFMPFPEEIDCAKIFETTLANGYLS